jgi:hypothetical protein
MAAVISYDGLEPLDHIEEINGLQVGVPGVRTLPRFRPFQGVLEQFTGDSHDDLREQLDESAVGVVGEAVAAGLAGQPVNRAVVQTKVEDRIHHPRHRVLGARTNRYKQGVLRVSESPAHPTLQPPEVLVDLSLKAIGEAA